MKTVPILAVLAALAAPVAAFGQTTIFSDGFVNSSTLNPTASTLVTPTANRTSYEIACAKNATGSGISSGTFTLSTAATSSGFNEAQALFTTAPITLTSAGQYIELFYTFKCTANVLNGTAGNSSGLYIGLYNSGGSAPTNGTFLWNGGMSSSSNNATTGGCQNWLGYAGDFLFSSNTLATSVISTRPAQTLANNFAQELLYATVYTGGSGFSGSHAGTLAEPSLTVGNYYTMALQITYVSSTSLAITNTIYGGAGIGGSVVSVGGYTTTYGGVSTSAQDITSTFDGLAIGYRAGATAATTLPITNITVIDYIPSLPAITGLTNETVVAGTSPTLSPSVTGVPTPSYQWQTNGVNIGGATSASLPLPSVQYAQNGYVYSLIASNLVGAVTNSMTLSVIVPPSITGLGNQAAATGDTVVLSPTIGGQPAPTLQWQTNGVNVTDGVDGNGSTISGSTTGTLTITGAQTGDSGNYSLIASNSAGIITNSMTLTVSGGNVLPSITGPLNQTNTQGANVTFSATVSGLPLPTVQWLDQTQTPITGAIGGHQNAGGIGRAGHFGGELPGVGGGDAGEVGPGGIGKGAVIHDHIIGLVGGQHAAMSIDGRLVAGDDDRVVGEGFGRNRTRLDVFRIGIGRHIQGEVNGVHRGGAVGDVVDFDGAGGLQHGRGAKGEVKRRVIADAGGAVRGREGGDCHD